MNEKTLYNAFAKISDTLTDTAYDAKKPARARVTGKLAAASLALVIVAAAVILVPAFSKAPVTETSGTEASAPDDENIIYRSESGDITVRIVEPLDVPEASHLLWLPLTEEMLRGAAEVFIGTIENVDEIEITSEFMGMPIIGHRSVLTVSVDETVKGTGEIAEGDTVKLISGLPPRMASESGLYHAIGKQYAFFLNKSSEIKNEIDLSPIAEYTYDIPGLAFIPLEEPQFANLLQFIGAEEGTCGEEFVEALRRYYEEN